MSKIFNHQPRKVGKDVQRRINALKIGQKMQDLPEELWHDSFRYYVKEDPNRKGGPNLRMIRLDPNKRSLTVTGYIYNKFVHPYENRFITPREAARLQGFPDELIFHGTLGQVQRQIGDAVPIELGNSIMHHLLKVATQLFPDKHKFLSLSLFSGAGGLEVASESIHCKTASWRTIAAIEIEKCRCDTLSGYFDSNLNIYNDDIRKLDPNQILDDYGITPNELTLVYGGPPCQSFSQTGRQKGIEDDRGKLIFEFLRFIDILKPPLFMFENVSNLKGIQKGKLLKDILKATNQIGYETIWDVLDASHYGNAQKRKRLICIGVRKDFKLKPSLPEPTHGANDMFLLPFKTVGEAFADLETPDYQPILVDD